MTRLLVISCTTLSVFASGVTMAQETNSRQPPEPVEQLYNEALQLTRDEYLVRENKLKRHGPAAVEFVRRRHAESEDAFERFFAQTLAEWLEGRPAEFREAMLQLQQLEQQVRQTPAGKPRPDVVEPVLTRIAGDRIADILALRLSKDTLFPDWLEAGTLRYLKRHGNERLLPALERYLGVVRQPAYRDYALEIIAHIRKQPGQ